MNIRRGLFRLWVVFAEYPSVIIANAAAYPALDGRSQPLFDRRAFNAFFTVTIPRVELETWAALWAVEDVTDTVSAVMRTTARRILTAGARLGR
jgi:hypothetical protein